MTDAKPFHYDYVVQIAKSLKPTSARIIESNGEVCGMPYAAELMRPLVRRGLFERVERRGFLTRWELTPLGLRVREYLENRDG